MTLRAADPNRSFGLSVGGVFCAIAALLLWRGHPGRAEVVGAIGVILVGCGWLRPALLARPSALWWTFARALGYVNARILLTVLFVLVLTPLAVVWRIVGKDPLGRRRERAGGWTPYPARYRDVQHYRQMY